MQKVKEFFEDNKIFAIITAITIITFLIGFIICFFPKVKNIKSEKRIMQEDTYTMYIKADPIIKITFKENFYTCGKKVCSEYTTKILSQELINDEAKAIFKNTNIKGKNLFESIGALANDAKKANKTLNSVSLISNWKQKYSSDDFLKEIKKYNKETTIAVSFDYRDVLDEEDIIKNNKVNTYKVNFDSNYGSTISEQSITENDKITKPTDPTREGYEFVEWQLNNRRFDFNTKVTKDITLKARWKKLPTVSTTTTTKTTQISQTNPTEQPTNQVERNEINLNDSVEYKVKTSCSYIKINDDCLGKTYETLLNEYPSDEFAEMLANNENLKNEKLTLTSYKYINYFPACKAKQIDINTIIGNTKGIIIENNSNGNISFSTIAFTNNKYNKFKNTFQYSKNNLVVEDSNCKENESEQKVLDEATCKTYKLACSRW